MIYYTQLIFVKPGQECIFHAFEDEVLPLLSDHEGELLYRIRPTRESFITNSQELPYEVHIVSFKNKTGFENYAKDPRRLACLDQKNASVERIVLIEGTHL
jgi:hypothetical protein